MERRAALTQLLAAMEVPPNPNVNSEDRTVPGPEGAPDVRVRVYRPVTGSGPLPGIYFIHGGGMILGDIEGEDAAASAICDRVGAVVVSVDYRLAPEHPHPAPVEDCYAGLTWMARNAGDLGIDPERLAVYGGSAGGGLTVAVCLLARDRGFPAIRFQMPIYPMIDDRNETPSSHEISDIGIWDRAANIEAWAWYLGDGKPDEYAAPARAEDLSGLPPAFIDVGTVDLFRDEDIAFAMRLMAAGVPVELRVAAIFWAIMPLLPMPVTTTRPRRYPGGSGGGASTRCAAPLVSRRQAREDRPAARQRVPPRVRAADDLSRRGQGHWSDGSRPSGNETGVNISPT